MALFMLLLTLVAQSLQTGISRSVPSCDNLPVSRVVGNYEAWASDYRRDFRMIPEMIPFGYYTHIVYSYLNIDPKSYRVIPGNGLNRIGAITLIQPDIEIWIAVGGWANAGPTQTTLSEIAASAEHSETFIDSLIKLMNTYHLHGVEINYPVEDRGRQDYKSLVTLMQKLRERFNIMGKGLSLTIPAEIGYLEGFDLAALEPTVDWFSLMTYDLHGGWELKYEATANSHTNLTEIQVALDLLWTKDVSPQKVTMGMASYGRSFALTDPRCNEPGCRVNSVGNAGRQSNTAGVLINSEMREIIEKKGLQPVLNLEAAVKTVTWDNQWVSFDDVETWHIKANVARSQCIGGFSLWAITQDDRDSTNIQALTQALGRLPRQYPNFKSKSKSGKKMRTPPKLCRWPNHFESCPLGFKEVMDANPLCCPADSPLPNCTWRGHRTSGKCRPGCKDGEVEVGTSTAGCFSEHQSACCEDTEVTSAYGKCAWTECEGTCGDMHLITSSSRGSGMQPCLKGKRAYCCSETPPEFAGKCKWTEACPADYVRLALDIYNEAFCCEQPRTAPWQGDETKREELREAELKSVIKKYHEHIGKSEL